MRPSASAVLLFVSFVLATGVVHAGNRTFSWDPPPGGQPISAELVSSSGSLFIELEPHSVRAANHRRFDWDGASPTRVVSEAPRTYRGTLFDVNGGPLDGARVALTRLDAGMRGIVFATDGTFLELRPLGASRYALVSLADMPLPGAGVFCAVDGPSLSSGGGVSPAIVGTRTVDLAVEIDFAYVQWAGSAGAAEADVEAILNAVSALYEHTFDVTFHIVATLVQTAGMAPYTTNDDTLFMVEIMNQWQSKHADIARDLVHVMSGKVFPSGVAGRAWLGGLCDKNFGYGWSAATAWPLFVWRWAVTAHEIGHNFGANHCDGAPDCGVMCAGLITCAGFSQFGASEQQEIQAHLAAVQCLAVIPAPIVPPFFEPFASKKTSLQHWSAKQKTQTNAVGEPSPKRAAALDGSPDGLILATNRYDLSGTTDPWVSFRAQPKGVEAGEALVLERASADGVWIEVGRVESSGVDRSTFFGHAFPLPAEAHTASLSLRLRAGVDQKNDRWFVDDFRVAEKSDVVGDLPLPGDAHAGFVWPIDTRVQSLVEGVTAVRNRGDWTAPLSFTASVDAATSWLQMATVNGALAAGELIQPIAFLIDASSLPPGVSVARVDVQGTTLTGAPLGLPVAAIVTDGAFFTAGDTLTVSLSGTPGELSVAYFVGVSGMKISLSTGSGAAESAEEAEDATVSIVDPDGQVVASATRKQLAGKAWKTKLAASGLFAIVVASGDVAGELALDTARTLPKKGLGFDQVVKPDAASGGISRAVVLETGARLSVTVAPMSTSWEDFEIGVVDPAGAALDVRAWQERLVGNGMTLVSYPIGMPGVYQVTVTGFVGAPKVSLTVDPAPPPCGNATVVMSPFAGGGGG